MSNSHLADGRTDCSHIPEQHIVYDRIADRYRATLRCRCRKVMVTCRHPRATLDAAQADGRVLGMLARRVTQ